MKDKHLIDIFREMNPNVSEYTFDTEEERVIKKQSRLDFFLISENLWSCFTECYILPKYQSDHYMITLSLKDERLWEFDNSLLSDKDFVKSIHGVIQNVQERFSHSRRGAAKPTDQEFLEILLKEIREECFSFSSSEENETGNESETNNGVEEGESKNILSGIIPRIKLENGKFTDEPSVIQNQRILQKVV